jgi:hypothetical protein
MITPLIEKAILNGWGTLRNYSLTSGISKIDIPENHFGIITDFKYFPFTTAGIGSGDGNVLSNMEGDTFQEVCFYHDGKSDKWTFKVNFTLSNEGAGGGLQHCYFPTKEFLVDTFIIANTDIYAQIKNPQFLYGGAVSDFGTLTKTQLPSSPESLGTTVSTIRVFNDVAGNKYVFPSFEEAGSAPQFTYSNTANAQSDTQFYLANLGGNPNFNYNLPLLNVQVLLIAEQNRNLLNT